MGFHFICAMCKSTLGGVSGDDVICSMKSTHPDFAELVTLLVQCHHHLIHNSSFTGSQKGATIPFGVAPVGAVQLIFILWQRHCFPNDHVLARNTNARCDETVVIQFFVDGVSHTYESFDCVSCFLILSAEMSNTSLNVYFLPWQVSRVGFSKISS